MYVVVFFMKDKEIHLKREIRFQADNGSKLCYGTLNRKEARSLYLFYKPAFIVNTDCDTNQYIKHLRKNISSIISRNISTYKHIQPNMILDVEFSKRNMTRGVKSKASFELFIGVDTPFSSIEEYDKLMRNIGEQASNTLNETISSFAKLI